MITDGNLFPEDKLDILKREHAIALNEVKQLQREYSAAVAVRQKLAREYNKLKDYNYDDFTLVVKKTKKKNKPIISKNTINNLVKKTPRARKRKIMENDPFKPKPSLFGFHPWGDYESD